MIKTSFPFIQSHNHILTEVKTWLSTFNTLTIKMFLFFNCVGFSLPSAWWNCLWSVWCLFLGEHIYVGMDINYVCVCMYVWVCLTMCVCLYPCVCVCMHPCVCVCVYTLVRKREGKIERQGFFPSSLHKDLTLLHLVSLSLHWLVVCLTSQQHAKCISRMDLLRQFLHAAMLRQKLQIKLSTSSSHILLTADQPVQELTL